MSNELSKEGVIKLIPNKVQLVYLDRSDDLRHYQEYVGECIRSGTTDSLQDLVDNFMDYRIEVIDYFIKDLIQDVVYTYKVSYEEAKEFVETNRELLEDIIIDRDSSDILKDLFDNTLKTPFFYDVGHDVPNSLSMTTKQIKKVRKNILKALNINRSDRDTNNNIDQMIQEACFGGSLVLYFLSNGSEFIFNNIDNMKSMLFKNTKVAIVDHINGSGSHCEISIDVIVPFSRQNIFIDREIKYNYSFNVCGMVGDWCESTYFELGELDLGKVKINEKIKERSEKENHFKKIYQEGGCSAGDNDITRHRDVYYKNEPMACGNKCPHCGKFWID